METTCAIDDCDRLPCNSRGWCSKHYQRWQKHGDPEQTKYIVGDDTRRFMSKVVVRDDGCWQWTGRNGETRGRFRLRDRWITAARWIWEQRNGSCGGWICHRCHNSWCVNPDHVYCGDPKSNVADMLAAGRDRIIGEKNNGAKITEADVLEIDRLLRETKLSQHAIAERFGVKQSAVSRIKRRVSWRHLFTDSSASQQPSP